jgi:hypothetical protein
VVQWSATVSQLAAIPDGKIKLGDGAKKFLALPVDPVSKDFAAWDGNDSAFGC